MQYAAHARFIEPARPRSEFWRLVLGVLVAAAVYVAAFFALLGVLALVGGGVSGVQAWLQQMARAEAPTGALLLLATFLGMALGPMLAVRWVHRRTVGGLFGPRRRLLRDFGLAAVVGAAVLGASALIPSGFTPQENLSLSLWASFLPIALVGILVQTGAEEVLFRGYLQQQLAARFGHVAIWMILPSVLFALAHYDPETMGDNAWLIVAATGLFALMAADLTARTGSLGAAWGFHFINNVIAILVVSLDGPLSGLALYTTPFAADAAEILRPLILRDMAVTVVAWAAIRWAVSR